MKRTKARVPVQRDAKEALAEVLAKLTGKLEAPAVSSSVKESRRGNTVGPNRDRLTVGVKNSGSRRYSRDPECPAKPHMLRLRAA